jgi:glycosyltransferase involved in cell wall biosynthesis
MATTNRIAAIAKGLILHNCDVKVICTRPTELRDKPVNINVSGFSKEGIEYIYTAKTVYWPKSIIGKLFVILKGFVGFFLNFNRIHRRKGIDIVISTTTNYFFNFFFSTVAKRYGCKTILTLDEYPRVIRASDKYPVFFRWFYLRSFYKLFDAAIIMTNVLIEYYKPLLSERAAILHLPMSVDADRFSVKSDQRPFPYEYIAYCGNLGHDEKDGVPDLIVAFSYVAKRYPDIKLLIIGGTNSSAQDTVFEKLRTLARNLNIHESIVFTGRVGRDVLPDFLMHAKVLALARPASLQAHGGFPTKLGEYLATGRPVVVTNVGEISYYLQDEQNSFVVKPGDPRSFADKLLYVLDNYEQAVMIAKRGQKLSATVFNSQVQSTLLYDFLSKVMSPD